MNRLLHTITLSLFCLIAAELTVQASPKTVKTEVQRLSCIDTIVNSAIAQQTIPGAVVAVVRGDKTVYIKAFGNKQIYPDTVPMTIDAVFDLASVSKAVATTTCAMLLIEKGLIRLEDRVDKFLPNFRNYTDANETQPIRVVDLLTHTSGLPSYVGIATLRNTYGTANRETLTNHINTCKRQFPPRTKFLYSCLNFITLQFIIEKVSEESLQTFAQKNLFLPLGMAHTDYCPKGKLKSMCVPTERQPDGTVLKGIVHDPLAQIANNGISGNAGLFSTAGDLTIFSAMLLGDGAYHGKRILKPSTVQQLYTEKLLGRALGWDISSAYASAKSDFGNRTIVHTGYTGTSIMIDFDSKTAIIILTNRVHPGDKGSVVPLRKAVANCVYRVVK